MQGWRRGAVVQAAIQPQVGHERGHEPGNARALASSTDEGDRRLACAVASFVRDMPAWQPAATRDRGFAPRAHSEDRGMPARGA